MLKNTQVQKQIILAKALELVATFGWSDDIIGRTATKMGYDENHLRLIFINGTNELIDMYFNSIDDAMMIELSNIDTSGLGVSAKIRLALKTRIRILNNYRDVTAKTISFLGLPWNAAFGLKLGWRSMDRIWSEFIQDSSVDFNYYTKRALLYAAYATSVQFFLGDYSSDLSETDDFIDRRIENVLGLGKFIAKFKS